MRHLLTKLLKLYNVWSVVHWACSMRYLHALSTNQNSRLTRMFLYQIVSSLYNQIFSSLPYQKCVCVYVLKCCRLVREKHLRMNEREGVVVGCHFIATKLVTFGAEYIVTSNNSIAWDIQEMTLFSIVQGTPGVRKKQVK